VVLHYFNGLGVSSTGGLRGGLTHALTPKKQEARSKKQDKSTKLRLVADAAEKSSGRFGVVGQIGGPSSSRSWSALLELHRAQQRPIRRVLLASFASRPASEPLSPGNQPVNQRLVMSPGPPPPSAFISRGGSRLCRDGRVVA
jgi:hypothetical protein